MINITVKDNAIKTHVSIDSVKSVVDTTPVNVNGDTKSIIKYIDRDSYNGDYVVTPRPFEPVVLETKDKLMSDDVTVKKVPYYKTSNSTGETVYIAMEV